MDVCIIYFVSARLGEVKTVYRRAAKGRANPALLRVWLILAIAFLFIMHALYSFFIDSSNENRRLSKKYTVFFRTKESTSTSRSIHPQWSEALLNIVAAKEEAKNPSLTQRPSARPNNVSHVTGKFYDFQDLNVVTASDVINDVSTVSDSKVVSGVSITSDVSVVSGSKIVSDVNIVSDAIEETYELEDNKRKLCDMPSDLGPISANTSDIALDVVEQKYPEVKLGGRYSPPDCLTRSRVAIIVPYRDRMKNLGTFLNHMHPFLIKQKLEYGIFIVEQRGIHEFNRGKLMNVGFLEAGGFQCYIFHDIDLLPLDERNLYTCPYLRHPRLYDAGALEGNELQGTLKRNFGGVSALTVEQFANINGYSNGYWGFGGEDNDLYYRMSGSGYTVTQYNSTIARYKALKHKQKSRNPRRYRLLLQTMKAFQYDGLSTLEYKLVSKTHFKLYTHILVNIDHSYHEVQEMFQEHKNFKHLKEMFVLRAKQSHDPTTVLGLRKRRARITRPDSSLDVSIV